MKPFYSVEAIISCDDRNYKGTLDFYDTKCILYNALKTLTEFNYTLDRAEFESGITRVVFLNLYSKEKPYLLIRLQHSESPRFILDDDKIDETLNALRTRKEQCRITQGNKSDKAYDKCNFQIIQTVVCHDKNWLSDFSGNPYAILGIPSNASNQKAAIAFDKIKKFDRLNTIHAYKTDYKLAGFQTIKRDIPLCQNALNLIKELGHKWFWFTSVEACQKWQYDDYRMQVIADKYESWTYDRFLAQYLYLLCFDKMISKRQSWNHVFMFYQYVIGGGHAELLREQLNEDEKRDIADEKLLFSFSENIFKPLDNLLRAVGIEAMLNLFRTIRIDKYSTLEKYKRDLGGQIAKFFLDEEKRTWDIIHSYIGTGELDISSTSVIRETVGQYENNVQTVYEDAIAALTKEPLRAEMIKESYKKIMRQAMTLLYAGGDTAEACRYANYYYPLADNENKLRILATYGLESITGYQKDIPELMKYIREKRPEITMQPASQFEDITICQSSTILPRVDFCGLCFSGQKIALRFWLSNRTETKLTFWIMDINVNDTFCGSTEIIGSVQSEENDFFTYELSLPDSVSYQSVSSIRFYVEIDKPDNITIYDTQSVTVTCDTNREIFSATYTSASPRVFRK